jgi:putative membrane protein
MTEHAAKTSKSGHVKPKKRVLTDDETEEVEELRMKKTTGIAGRLFHAPSIPKMILVMLALSFFIGFLAHFNFADPGSNLTADNVFSYGIIFGIGAIALPAVIAGLVMTPAAKALGGIFYERRAMLLALSSVVIISIVLMIAKLFTIYRDVDIIFALTFCYAWAFAFQYAILLALSSSSYIRSLLPAIIQPALGLVMIITLNDLVIAGYEFTTYKLAFSFVFILIFFVMTAVWITIVAWPLRREFSANGLDLARQGFQHFTEGEGKGMELENFFESFGKTTDAEAGILAIRRRDGADRSSKPSGDRRKYKGVLIVPDLHKGPFGYLAGSNMPEKIGRELEDESEHVIFAHGAATHDRNPVSTAETLRLARAISTALNELTRKQFSNSGGKFVRVHNGDGVKIGMQYIGDAPISIYTSAPEPTDDINYRIGMKAREIIGTSERSMATANKNDDIADSPMFIDGHNSMEPGKGYIHFTSPKKDLIYAILKEAVEKASSTRVDHGLKIGISQKLGFDVEKDGLGPLGIQVITVNTSPDSKMAYIIFDGNNLQMGLRKKILEHVKAGKLVDHVEVLTTDNHIVNMTIGGYAPVGEKLDHNKLLKTLDKLVAHSVDDLEPVEVASTRVSVENFKVFGQGNTFRLSTAINKTVSIMGKSFVMCFSIATLLSIGALIFLG